MKSYCYICGSDKGVCECPKCENGFCKDCLSGTKDQETGAPLCFDCEIDGSDQEMKTHDDITLTLGNSVTNVGFGEWPLLDNRDNRQFSNGRKRGVISLTVFNKPVSERTWVMNLLSFKRKTNLT